MRGADADARGRGGRGGCSRAFTEHRIVGVELAAERDGLCQASPLPCETE